jgi:hypothetical protein
LPPGSTSLIVSGLYNFKTTPQLSRILDFGRVQW